jgi:hypothetical protein
VKEKFRMQFLAGLITESKYKQLLEDEEVINRILDKISDQGKDSLTPEERSLYLAKKGYLNTQQFAQGLNIEGGGVPRRAAASLGL